MSREEAEREERRRRSDDVRLQLALSQSQNDFQSPGAVGGAVGGEKKAESNGQSHLLDLLDVSLSPGQPSQLDPWGLPDAKPKPDTSSEAWSGVNSPARDPWAPANLANPANSVNPANPDPWAPLAQSKSPVSVISSPSSELEQFDALSQRPRGHQNNNNDGDPFDLSGLGDKLSASPPLASSTGAIKKSPSAFLGENSSLVNLERLLQPAAAPAAPNPFAVEPPRQMFAQPQPAKLSINEIKQQQMGLAPSLAFPSSSPAFNAPPLAMGSTMPPLGSTMPPLGSTMGSTMPPLGSTMSPLGGAPLSGAPLGGVAADPWAPARSSSPWSPPPARHTPNPFLS